MNTDTMQFITDIFLVAAVCYLFFSVRREGRGGDDKRLKAALESLEGQAKAVNATVERISSETVRFLDSSKEMMEALELKKGELQRYLERIDNLLGAIDEGLPSKDVIETGDNEIDIYKEAARLAEEGYGVDEIVKRVGLPKGEVQLILGLKR